jgi:hypothetical protein
VNTTLGRIGKCLKPFRIRKWTSIDEAWEVRPRLKVYKWLSRFSQTQDSLLQSHANRTRRAFIALDPSSCTKRIVDALLACDDDGICLQSSGREPEHSLAPFENLSHSTRFDYEPWHLWRNVGECEYSSIVRVIFNRMDLMELLPPVWPRLGLLQPIGIRVRARIYCAHRLSWTDLVRSPLTPSVIRQVLRICRGW